jgi:hypothetical protein
MNGGEGGDQFINAVDGKAIRNEINRMHKIKEVDNIKMNLGEIGWGGGSF